MKLAYPIVAAEHYKNEIYLCYSSGFDRTSSFHVSLFDFSINKKVGEYLPKHPYAGNLKCLIFSVFVRNRAEDAIYYLFSTSNFKKQYEKIGKTPLYESVRKTVFSVKKDYNVILKIKLKHK